MPPGRQNSAFSSLARTAQVATKIAATSMTPAGRFLGKELDDLRFVIGPSPDHSRSGEVFLRNAHGHLPDYFFC